MSANLYRGIGDLKGFSLKNCPPMAEPSGVLMCPPDHFQVLAVKNPYMARHVGDVNRDKAKKQWEDLVTLATVETTPAGATADRAAAIS